ncbi:hypothetical protein [Streptomyces sp. R44]|uniref:Uncharacterized protein n=1 Tax=Streptomyces sp. R44 TaxID=3238633 RepID=A0AB39SNJ7_9ACTN
MRVAVIALLVLLTLLFLWTVVSDRLARWSITAPIAFALAGILLSGQDHPVVPLDMDTHTFQRTIELVLAVMLFTDATEARDYARLRGPVGEGRLLGIALPASVVLATLAGALVFPGRSWWLLAVAALVVMPMDLAPVLMILRDERVPLRVWAALNIEGGFNDGLISPLFVFCVANLVSAGGETFGDLLLNALKGAVYAAIIGSVLGYLACLRGPRVPPAPQGGSGLRGERDRRDGPAQRDPARRLGGTARPLVRTASAARGAGGSDCPRPMRILEASSSP